MKRFNARGVFEDVLGAIVHKDSKGEEFTSQKFDYYDDVKSKEGYKPFKEEEVWDMPKDDLRGGGCKSSINSWRRRRF